MSDELATEIETVRFGPVRLREGYDMDEVDTFLDRLAAAARAGEPLSQLCSEVRFTPVRMREGYDVGEVDAFLARVGGTAPAAPATAPAAAPEPSAPPTPAVIQEQHGLLDRILHRD